MANLLDQLAKEIGELQKTRDELKVKLQHAKADAKTEWTKLEARLSDLEGQLRGFKAQAKEPAHDVVDTAKRVAHELKVGFERVKSRF